MSIEEGRREEAAQKEKEKERKKDKIKKIFLRDFRNGKYRERKKNLDILVTKRQGRD